MKRCMIVDGSSVIRKVAKRILTGPDVTVIEAGSGAEALGLCATEMPDIIIVDGALQDMSSADFIRAAVSVQSLTKPYLVLCLAEMDIGAIMRAKRAGACGYILKPFNRPQLLEKFRQLQDAA